jgi:hypothetical protein
MKRPNNWLEAMLPFPRPEYAKQTESLLTDLLWRSPGSNLSTAASNGTALIDELPRLKDKGETTVEPKRLVPEQHRGGNPKVRATLPVALTIDSSTIFAGPQGAKGPVEPVLRSLFAPQARGDKSTACVPIHPSIVALQTLHGLVNKASPANLADAIECMGWLGGAESDGEVAARFLRAFQSKPVPAQGTTGAVEWLLSEVARHTWESLPSAFGKSLDWPRWPQIGPNSAERTDASFFASLSQTPFNWFWGKWQSLTNPENNWSERLPARRFVDWALCLLRTGLAFSYLWEAEFYCRLHERVALRRSGGAGGSPNRLETLLLQGTPLAIIEPASIPPSQKEMWPATAELIARGWKARDLILEHVKLPDPPEGASLFEKLDEWVSSLQQDEYDEIGVPLQTTPRMANNQKEFVKYLLLPRASDDDAVDQADFYFLAQTNRSGHAWFRPGPEWLVVVTGLLCGSPGCATTLGQLLDDLACLGIRAERSVLLDLLEEAGLSNDSPDADNALVIRSGF